MVATITMMQSAAADDSANSCFELSDFHSATSKDPLYVGCKYWNVCRQDDAAVAIRGVLSHDSRHPHFSGYFFPLVQLAVAPKKNGPWTAIQPSIPRGSSFILRVPTAVSVVGLNVDVTPFVRALHSAHWARISLPNGESTVIDITEISDAWKNHLRSLPR
jgi:hypothetical protein